MKSNAFTQIKAYRSVINIKEAHKLKKNGAEIFFEDCLQCKKLIASTEKEKYCSKECEKGYNLFLIKLGEMVVRFKTENWAMMDDIVEYKGEKLQVMLTNATPEALLKGKKDNFNYVLTDGNKFLEVKDLTVPLKKK